jgi:hypothetical protein
MTQKSQLFVSKRRPAAARPTSFRPALETLEDRMVLSSQVDILSTGALITAPAVHRAEVPQPVVGLTLDQGSTQTVIMMGMSAGDDWESRTATVHVAATNLGGPAPNVIRTRIINAPVVHNVGEDPVEQVSLNFAHLQTMEGGTAPLAFAAGNQQKYPWP